MATVPTGTKFRGISAGENPVERGSRRKNNAGEIYTIGDIIETVATDPTSVTGTVNTLAHYDTAGNLGEAGEVTVNATGEITSTADITTTADISTAGLTITGALNKAFGTAPTAATPGTQGDIIVDATNIYVCTVTGVADAATWLKTPNPFVAI